MFDYVIPTVIFDCIGLVLIGLAAVRIRHLMSGKRMDSKILLWNVEATAVYIVLHSLSYLLNERTFPGARILNIVCIMLLSFIGIFIMYTWVLYVDYCLYQSLYRLKHSNRPLLVVLFLCFLVIATNPFTGLLFTVDGNNNFVSGPGYIGLMIVLVLFVIYIGIIIVNYRNKFGGLRFFPVASFILPMIVSFGLGFITNDYFSVVPLGSSISLCGVVMGALEEIAYRDPRTGFYNEFYYNYIMSPERVKKYGFASGIMFVIKDLEAIVRDEGYSRTRETVRKVAELIRSELPEGCEAMYMGEGQFLLITKVTNIGHLRFFEENVADALLQDGELKVELLSGHALMKEKGETDDFLREINESLRLVGAE
ncbi:MAG: hypothetical protein K5989_09645 [Lachnospiraceae bacterium]|nr:hypothetical protein [Lachnospiraceae bacterium]